jgi:hypothetical protein
VIDERTAPLHAAMPYTALLGVTAVASVPDEVQLRLVGFQNSAVGVWPAVLGCAFVFVDQASKDRAACDPLLVMVRGGMIGAW